MSNDDKSASQFISALVKNLQAVCHGHVEFDKNVKVVGHLYLTVDSGSEFNYIVNEKVSKSDESSTTFISKSFYATDPQQKTPKKNVDRPLPPPTPNVLGKTRYDISVDLTDEPSMGGGRYPQMQQRNQFNRPHGGYSGHSGMQRPQMRRRPFDQNRMPPHQMAKMPRFSSPQRQSMNFPSTSPRKMPTSPSQRFAAPSTITSSSPSLPSPVSISPESVSATPAHSLPGADKPEDNVSNKTDTPDIKFEIVKVENGSGDGGNKNTTEADKGEIRIESVTSHDLSLDNTASTELDSEKTKNIDSDIPPDSSEVSEETTEETSKKTPAEQILDTLSADTSLSENMETDQSLKSDTNVIVDSSSSQQRPPPPEEPEVIEIDLTMVKDEIDSVLDSESSYMYDSSQQRHSIGSAQGGDNSLSSYGNESNDDDFFNSLREQTVGLYPVGLHANETAGQNFQDIPNLPGSQGAYMSGLGTSASSSQNNQQGTLSGYSCNYCNKVFTQRGNLSRHVNSMHLKIRIKCPFCSRQFSQKGHLKDHINKDHGNLFKTGQNSQQEQY